MKRICRLLALFMIVFSCRDQQEYDYPLIQTGEVTEINNTGAVFHAKIFDPGRENIIDYGFVWGFDKAPDISSSKFIVKEPARAGVFSERVTSDLYSDTIYYVRAFARNENYITYGKSVSFRSLGSLAPLIRDFTPKEGSSGTRITITGYNFSTILTGNIVKIGRITATIEEAAADQLIVVLPDNVSISGPAYISVRTAGRHCISDKTFFLQGCNIIGFRPSNLPGSGKIYVRAADFDPVISGNTLKIGNLTAQIIDIVSDTIVAIVPYNTTAGPNELSLNANGKICYFADPVNVLSPWGKVVFPNTFYRSGPAGFSIAASGFVGTGRNSNGDMFYSAFSDLWRFNPVDNSLVRCAELPDTARENAISFSVAGKGYIGLGHSGGVVFFKDLYEYDPGADKWTRKSDYPGNKRTEAFCLAIANKAYIAFVNFSNETIHDFWEYDPSADKWTKKADYPADLGVRVVGFELKGRGYIGLGINLQSFAKKDFWEYNPQTDTWKRLADFPGSERAYGIGFAIGNAGFIGTGLRMAGYEQTGLTDFWKYDPGYDKWTRIPDLPYRCRIGAISFTIGEKGYICSGVNDSWTSGAHSESFIVLDPKGL